MNLIILIICPYLLVANPVDDKRVHFLTVTRSMELSSEKIWQIIGVDYGDVAAAHPGIVSSDYIDGSDKAAVGAARVCYLNQKKTRYFKEKIIAFDQDAMRLINQMTHTGKLPLHASSTQTEYSVTELANGQSKVIIELQFRSRPAFMGRTMKRKFRKLIEDYLIGVEHHGLTGERVTKRNFKKIKKNYRS